MHAGKIAIIVLAAGASERFGSPKQLVYLAGEPLLVRALRTALSADLGPVYTVIGAHSAECLPLAQSLPVQAVICAEWREGMSASIRCGVGAAALGQPDAVILMLCDQPNVDAALLRNLKEEQVRTGLPMVAVSYSGVPGVPALFTSSCFAELMELQGKEGARWLLRRNAQLTALIEATTVQADIDTPEDLSRAQ